MTTRYVSRISRLILLIYISYGCGLPSYAADRSDDVAANKTISHATQLRVNNSQEFRDLQAASNLNLGSVITREILIDRYPTFRSNLNWLNTQVQEMRPFVLGGEPTKPEKYTDVVGIMPYIPTSGLPKSLCTGVLISKNTVLTAAHCICDRVAKFVQFGSVVSSNSKAIAVKNSTIFSGIDCTKYRTLSDAQKTKELKGRDLAVLELNEEVPTELGIPRRIVDSTILSGWNQRSIRVVGYGLDERNQYGRKIHADIALVSARCSSEEADVFGCAPALEIVAQSKDFSTDTCNGDSGGPAYIYDQTSDHYYLVAITSRGLPSKPCGHGGVYELVSSQSATKFLAQKTDIMIGRGPRQKLSNKNASSDTSAANVR
jgi:hypothetical protein